jgi:hypothetical protein
VAEDLPPHLADWPVRQERDADGAAVAVREERLMRMQIKSEDKRDGAITCRVR